MYSTEIPSNTDTIKEVISTALMTDFLLKIVQSDTQLCAISAPSYKQPNKLSQLQKPQLNLLTVTFHAI